MHIGYVKSQHKDDKSPLKGAWSGSHDTLNCDAPMISLERLKLQSSNFASGRQHQRLAFSGEAKHFKFHVLIDTEEYKFMYDILLPKRMCSESCCDLFKFPEISDNISETVQDRNIVAMED